MNTYLSAMEFPGCPGAREYFEKAYEAQMRGDLAEAVELYQRSIEVEPTAEAHTFLGWTYSFMGRVEDAIAECERAIEVDPDFGNPYNDIGAYLIELGRFQEAIPWLRRAMEAKRYEARHFPHINLAHVHLHGGDVAAAIGELRACLRALPTYEPAKRELLRLLERVN